VKSSCWKSASLLWKSLLSNKKFASPKNSGADPESQHDSQIAQAEVNAGADASQRCNRRRLIAISPW